MNRSFEVWQRNWKMSKWKSNPNLILLTVWFLAQRMLTKWKLPTQARRIEPSILILPVEFRLPNMTKVCWQLFRWESFFTFSVYLLGHEDSILKCKLCSKSVNKTDLVVHRKEHHGKERRCLVCEKKSSTSADAEKHLILHTGIKPFECNICDAKFAFRG